MRLVLQRAHGDCAICAISTLSEVPYEDVFIEAAKVEPQFRGRSGLFLPHITAICKRLGLTVKAKRVVQWDDDEGLLVVTWLRGSRHGVGGDHLVALSDGVIADSADGVILPPDEYFAREKAKPGAFLEWRS